MIVDDICVFIPSKDFDLSTRFYEALGFENVYSAEALVMFRHGQNTFYLQDFYQQGLAENLMILLSVVDIQKVLPVLESMHEFRPKYDPIVEQPWGKVIALWGPSGELWHITQFND